MLGSSALQRGSGAPLKYQLLPLSARIIPYFFIRRARRSERGYPLLQLRGRSILRGKEISSIFAKTCHNADMKLVVNLKLQPTKEQTRILRETLELANQACEHTSEIAWHARMLGCGHRLNADFNAALNIRSKGFVNVPQESENVACKRAA